ncbi:class I SAM-dependent methyltransferase [Scopulibacillus cellulosilyticus]|uniref:Class I SAM-dependent methyltransferase n=1 Tax=Scopulibacillus cellulosilyticus TaxID=2665665 RepID=A0ABW2Q0S8_9BACL
MNNLFPHIYDKLMAPLEKGKLKSIRKDLLEHARGKVLEIGAGTGVNFPLYRHAEKVIALEPNPKMIKLAASNMQNAKVPIETCQQKAEMLPFQDCAFDTVTATLVFCTIPPEKAFQEIYRVLKPGGRLLMLEHIRMQQPMLARLQDFLTPAWKKVCDGCCLNRQTLNLLKGQNLFHLLLTKYYFKGLFAVTIAEKRGL